MSGSAQCLYGEIEDTVEAVMAMHVTSSLLISPPHQAGFGDMSAS